MNFSSKLLEQAVEEFGRLPGIGKKTALRLVLHLLQQNEQEVYRFTETINTLKSNVKYCRKCFNITDEQECEICTSPKREKDIICVVEDTRDVMAIENTNQYTGTYHVLGGLISPLDGVGPSDLRIEELIERIQGSGVSEVILALSATMEGDTTIFYIYKRLREFNLKISTIARGISFGGELEYVDEVTLGKSILTRVPYERNIG
ncbi:MAG TPA: recombination mediator RecR [Candidatus Sphingobacterium stercoripullorum]|uniref:Recombination protein RecR n=1 Tax=Candidatus Sphingobacterium stercoripullorum TaxID=2838759 RepID=A0A9D2B0E6_9SPHI|nr:recombination mediator RecR [Candidatus Sphingobacterium stercoripullorum]HLR50111.1 recombination mediator RecR [Candidatus Sphingobacterium stercoripullorum]